MATRFLICALLYGDYPELAARCAGTIAALRRTGGVDVRVGLNDVSARSRAIVDAVLPGVDTIAAEPQIYKYPMMRRLVHEYAGDATHLMWFDDDSCLRPGTDAAVWLERVGARAGQSDAVLGSVYRIATSAVEQAWVQRQPWYAGRPHPPKTLFPVGGWFVAPLGLLRRFDWPPSTLRHNGGDVAFGALLHQQNVELAVVGEAAGVAINADASLHEGTASRRGYSESALGM